MGNKTEKSKSVSHDEALELSFEEYDRKYGVKLRYPTNEEYPGFPVSKVSGFRWIRKEERRIITAYAERRKRKPLRVNLNVALYRIKKRIHP